MIMKTSKLLTEIKKTERSIAQAQENIIEAIETLSEQSIPEPYCYMMPVCAFILCYQLHDKISLSSASRYLLALSKA